MNGAPRFPRAVRSLLGSLLATAVAARAALPIVWPTPNAAIERGEPIERYVQSTVSGETTSGLFGCVRSNGFQFHEGIDLFPLKRERGEPADPVFAAMDGVVRHVSARAGDSSYGRYIVLEHPGATPAVYTLYAHLAAIEPGVRIGTEVKAGQTIAKMGRSAGGYAIPPERAHLHFEIGLAATREFQRWYDGKKFGSKNEHGMWNGMNLLGVDPRDYYLAVRAGRVVEPLDYLRSLPVAVKVQVATLRTPDFAQRYPALVKGEALFGPPAGWEIECYWTGLPLSLRPLTAIETAGLRPGTVRIVSTNRDELVSHRAISLLKRGSTSAPGPDLLAVLEKLFGPLR